MALESLTIKMINIPGINLINEVMNNLSANITHIGDVVHYNIKSHLVQTLASIFTHSGFFFRAPSRDMV